MFSVLRVVMGYHLKLVCMDLGVEQVAVCKLSQRTSQAMALLTSVEEMELNLAVVEVQEVV